MGLARLQAVTRGSRASLCALTAAAFSLPGSG